MSLLRRIPAGAWTALAVIVVVVAVYLVGRANPIPPPPVTTDALGPDNSETAAEYTARAAQSLEQPGDPAALHWALVSLPGGVSAAAAAAAAAPVRISEVLVHVPLDDAQTPVTAVQVPAADDPAAMVSTAQGVAADTVASSAGTTGTAGRVVDALRGGCGCVVGLVVHARLDQLRTVAGRDGVAAVDALPADAVFGGFAVRPATPLLG